MIDKDVTPSNNLNRQFVSDIRGIIEKGVQKAYASTSTIQVLTYWHIGHRIVEEEQQGKERAEYGTYLMKKLASEIQPYYGTAYSLRNLQYMRRFYQLFPDKTIVNACVHNLSWTHFRSLLRVDDDNARYIARYSVLNGNQQLFASKYLTYLPTKEQLKREIERQKELFRLQHQRKA